MRIQKRTVDAISATDKRQFYWDDDLKGFGLRVEPTGLKSYVVRYRADGGGRNAPLRQVLIARHGEMTPEQARKEAERLLGSVRLGEDPGARRAEARACVTLRDLIAEFLDNHVDAKRKAATQRLYRQVLEQHVAPALGTRRAADIKRTDIARLHAKMRESPYQANRMLAIMGSLYAFSVSGGSIFQLPTNSAAPISAPSSISVSLARPRQITTLPGGGSLARAR